MADRDYQKLGWFAFHADAWEEVLGILEGVPVWPELLLVQHLRWLVDQRKPIPSYRKLMKLTGLSEHRVRAVLRSEWRDPGPTSHQPRTNLAPTSHPGEGEPPFSATDLATISHQSLDDLDTRVGDTLHSPPSTPMKIPRLPSAVDNPLERGRVADEDEHQRLIGLVCQAVDELGKEQGISQVSLRHDQVTDALNKRVSQMVRDACRASIALHPDEWERRGPPYPLVAAIIREFYVR